MSSDYTNFFELPRTPKEKEWLEERLETLSVKESAILAAAVQWHPPETAADAINLLSSLPDYDACCLVHDEEDLGRIYLADAGLELPDLVLAHTDMAALGVAFEDSHPGTFIGDCYVMYPVDPRQEQYDGTNLATVKDEGWSVKVKVGSPRHPEGVWVRLPDYDDNSGAPHGEIDMALRKLEAGIGECMILDARCVLPEAGNLMEQYDDLAELLFDGNNLGFLLDERAQGMQGFEQKLAAAIEYDDCQTLKDVIGCAEEIRRFSFVTTDKLEDYARSELKKAGAPEALIDGGLFDLEGLARDSLEQSGYRLDRTESVYLKPRQQEQQMTQGAMLMEQSI